MAEPSGEDPFDAGVEAFDRVFRVAIVLTPKAPTNVSLGLKAGIGEPILTKNSRPATRSESSETKGSGRGEPRRQHEPEPRLPDFVPQIQVRVTTPPVPFSQNNPLRAQWPA